MAGLDGIENRIDPGGPMDKNLYDLPPREQKKVPEVCGSLKEALDSLDKDRGFLKKGGVMDDDFIDAYIELKIGRGDAAAAAPAPGRVRHVLLVLGAAMSLAQTPGLKGSGGRGRRSAAVWCSELRTCTSIHLESLDSGRRSNSRSSRHAVTFVTI